MTIRSRFLATLAVTFVTGAGQAAIGAERPRHQGLPYGRAVAAARDLQGIWSAASLTTLERRPVFSTLVVSDAEAKAALAKLPAPSDPVGGPESEAPWWDHDLALARIDGQLRTSWIVDPPDGRLPLRPATRKLIDDYTPDLNGPEGRPISERCISATAGPPMLNALQNNNYQIVQTADHVVILMENNHEARIIRLHDRTHLPRQIKPWMGDSVGWWEKGTLVVETTGFNPGQSLRSNLLADLYVSSDAVVTERFTRTSADNILYEFTVNDPASYSRPWRAQMPLAAAKGPLFEYACQEGNYSMGGMLAGARKQEQRSAAAGVDP